MGGGKKVVTWRVTARSEKWNPEKRNELESFHNRKAAESETQPTFQ